MSVSVSRPQINDPRLSARFWKYVHPQVDGCWLWSGKLNERGYPYFKANGASSRAHRISYTALSGEIHGDMTLDHLCKTRSCVNPAHLESVTIAVNKLRAKRVVCERGHQYAMARSGRRRRCKTCRRLWFLMSKKKAPTITDPRASLWPAGDVANQ